MLVAEAIVLGVLAFTAHGTPTTGVVARLDDVQLVVSNQTDVLHSIHVDSVVTPTDSWLVVQADSGNGVPGAVIGSVYVPKGDHNDLTIQLDPSQPLPKRAFVTLLADGGQPNVLEFSSPAGRSGAMGGMGSTAGTGSATVAAVTKDQPIVAGGAVVAAHISLSPLTSTVEAGSASIASASVPATSTTVTLYGVKAPAQSWAVVSTEGTGGVPGKVLGQTAVTAGTHDSVTVDMLSPPGMQGMRATLHVDLGTLGVFEFTPLDPDNSPDQPYVAGGQSVSVPVHVIKKPPAKR